jgi:hypothetical protein
MSFLTISRIYLIPPISPNLDSINFDRYPNWEGRYPRRIGDEWDGCTSLFGGRVGEHDLQGFGEGGG